MSAGYFYYDMQRRGRKSGYSAVAHAAYITGRKLYDHQELCWRAYGQRERVTWWEISPPKDAPRWLAEVAQQGDIERLWNVAEMAELKRDGTPRQDATLYRSVVVSVDAGLFIYDAAGRVDIAASTRLQAALIREHVREMFLARGMAASWALHWNPKAPEDNPHAHIMLPTRAAVEEGFSKHKDGKLKASDRRHWQDNHVEQQRAHWAAIQSRELKRLGEAYTVEHRSYERRGLELESLPKHHGREQLKQQRQDQLTEQAERLIRNPRPLLKLLAEAFQGNPFTGGDIEQQARRYTATPAQHTALLAALYRSSELVRLWDGRWQVREAASTPRPRGNVTRRRERYSPAASPRRPKTRSKAARTPPRPTRPPQRGKERQ
jgi:hypothetical protein